MGRIHYRCSRTHVQHPLAVRLGVQHRPHPRPEKDVLRLLEHRAGAGAEDPRPEQNFAPRTATRSRHSRAAICSRGPLQPPRIRSCARPHSAPALASIGPDPHFTTARAYWSTSELSVTIDVAYLAPGIRERSRREAAQCSLCNAKASTRRTAASTRWCDRTPRCLRLHPRVSGKRRRLRAGGSRSGVRSHPPALPLRESGGEMKHATQLERASFASERRRAKTEGGEEDA